METLYSESIVLNPNSNNIDQVKFNIIVKQLADSKVVLAELFSHSYSNNITFDVSCWKSKSLRELANQLDQKMSEFGGKHVDYGIDKEVGFHSYYFGDYFFLRTSFYSGENIYIRQVFFLPQAKIVLFFGDPILNQENLRKIANTLDLIASRFKKEQNV